jgi:fructose-1,6-bisphosphatase/inositol monophosphatase family enzyme
MTGAGAVVSDLAGNPVKFPETTSLLCAATAELHDAALAIINRTS